MDAVLSSLSICLAIFPSLLAVESFWTPIPPQFDAEMTKDMHILVQPRHASLVRGFLNCSGIPNEVAIEDIQKNIDEENDEEVDVVEDNEGQLVERKQGEHHMDPNMDYETVIVDYEYYYYDDDSAAAAADYEAEELDVGDDNAANENVDEGGDEEAVNLTTTEAAKETTTTEETPATGTKTKSRRRLNTGRRRGSGGKRLGSRQPLLEMIMSSGFDLQGLFNHLTPKKKRKVLKRKLVPKSNNRESSADSTRRKRLVNHADSYKPTTIAESRVFRDSRAIDGYPVNQLISFPTSQRVNNQFPAANTNQFPSINNQFPANNFYSPKTGTIVHSSSPVHSSNPTTRFFLPHSSQSGSVPHTSFLPIRSQNQQQFQSASGGVFFPVTNVRDSSVRTRHVLLPSTVRNIPLTTTVTNVPVSFVPNSNSQLISSNKLQPNLNQIGTRGNLNSNQFVNFSPPPRQQQQPPQLRNSALFVPISHAPVQQKKNNQREKFRAPSSIIGKLIFHSQQQNSKKRQTTSRPNLIHLGSNEERNKQQQQQQLSPKLNPSPQQNAASLKNQNHNVGTFNVASNLPDNVRRPRHHPSTQNNKNNYHRLPSNAARHPQRQNPRRPKAIKANSNRAPQPTPNGVRPNTCSSPPSAGETRYPQTKIPKYVDIDYL
jgi:hypothetical protein